MNPIEQPNVAAERSYLAELLCQRTYLQREEGAFKLISGRRSANYFDSYPTTGLAVGLPVLGRVMLRQILSSSIRTPVACGGPANAAVPISIAIALASLTDAPFPIDAFSVRMLQKPYGTRNWVENCPPYGSSIAIVDDVVVTGSSILHAIKQCQAHGLSIETVVVLIDREEGGLDVIQKYVGAAKVTAIFTKRELDVLLAR